ncbi:hypothetical protein PSQ19_18455 [Devosia algicola]|uniref:Uncharacterized protein n=1 Tax=Devosia algicola TaxID=3026418 RepID=A0ABY7YMX4_9HYPH|nr:hypothetical protein [Devosia algicola]WDR02542.1 hypothetical protein PSQ19_18455 [Devosia algicola]
MPIHRFLAAVGLLAMFNQPLVAEPFHHPYGEWRDYSQDWLAICPDTIDESASTYYGFSCFASTGSTALNAANLPAYKLTLLLNRLTGALDIAITDASTDGAEIDPVHSISIGFNGAPTVTLNLAADLETRYNTVNQYFVVNDQLREDLLASMKARTAMTVTLPIIGAESDSRTIRFSLRGVTASLDFMASYARKLAQY